MNLLVDRKYRLPRIWSNGELSRFAPLFTGDVVNVSAWKDEDKQGGHYRDYFSRASSYSITNYRKEARGFQGLPDEIYLDLTGAVPLELQGRFDLVFNHTVLEHIYDVQTAFRNLCALSRDVVIIVVPFLQQMHSNYGDYWRFTPLALERMFSQNHLTMLYCSFNSHRLASVYLFAIAARHGDSWAGRIPRLLSHRETKHPSDGLEAFVGCHAIPNPGFAMRRLIGRGWRWLSSAVRGRPKTETLEE